MEATFQDLTGQRKVTSFHAAYSVNNTEGVRVLARYDKPHVTG